MKISLTVADRIAIQSGLHDRDSFENLCLRQEILDKTGFSADEVENNKIKTIQVGDKSNLTWEETEAREFEFNSTEIAYMNGCLKKLSDAKELTSLHLPLYKKISVL